MNKCGDWPSCDDKPKQDSGCYTNGCFKIKQSQETSEADVALNNLLCAERKAKAFDFIQEHATRIHFDDACDSLTYGDKGHFAKDDWLLKAIEKASI